MRLVLINDGLVGRVLASPIYTENGILFLNKGNTIGPSVIARLRKMGIITLYIEDDNNGITLQEVFPAPIKLRVVKAIKEVFEEVKQNEYVNDIKVSDILKDIMSNINLSENAALINNFVPGDELSKLALHCLDVTILTIMVGIRKKYDEKKLMKVGIAALMHDIGKLFTSDKLHVKKAQEVLKRNPAILSTTYMAVYYMYEREDASGLFGVEGEKVHEFAKILGICNEYINDISGEKAELPHVALEKLTAKAVSKFDKDIYKSFTESVYCYPNGLQVRLNNGQIAVVVKQNSGFTTRPILITKIDESYQLCNLVENRNLTLFIEEVIM